MKVQFLGAVQTVTGSRYLVTHGAKRVLVDCGLFQGFKNYREKNWAKFPIDPSSLDAVLLTHAHIDHSGYIPRLIQDGFRGPVYCTPETKALCAVMLPDAGYLQEEEAAYANKKKFSKHSPALPLYTEKQARASLDSFRDVEWDRPFSVAPGLTVRLTHAGHILGASHIYFEARNRRLLFSGDIGRAHDPMIGPPDRAEPSDLILIESTYGNRLHQENPDAEQLRDVINRTMRRGGVLVVPSFAVGRAQLLLFLIERMMRTGSIPNVPVYLNSPMAKRSNDVFLRYSEASRLTAAEMKRALDIAEVVESREDSVILNNRKGPMIIIAGSGMATGGRVLHHLKAFGGDSKNTILFSGFQVGGTRGDQIVRGAKEVKIHGELWPIRAEVASLENLSAHADQGELVEWLGHAVQPRAGRSSPKIFLVHGEPDAADALRLKIAEKYQIDARVPDLYETVKVE